MTALDLLTEYHAWQMQDRAEAGKAIDPMEDESFDEDRELASDELDLPEIWEDPNGWDSVIDDKGSAE